MDESTGSGGDEEVIKLEGLSTDQIKELHSKAEKHEFQAEVNRMMKLIINSLYRNKEIFLRELISNAADALDKIRLISLTDPSALQSNDDLSIRIKADRENRLLHITDSGIGMTKQELMNNLGTIARSGTAEFLSKLMDTSTSADVQQKEPKEDGAVEEEKEEKKTKEVEKTVWDWDRVNNVKPIWMRKPSQVEAEEYDEFYKSITKDTEKPLTHVHFTAEGEVTFRSILYVPKSSPSDMFQNYGKFVENIKLYVRRVFITDDFADMLPKYLSFIRGIVDSDDLPLNVSRENLQQHKLLKVIRKKLVRKVLDMLKKLEGTLFDDFWKEFSTNIKLGIMEDPSNRIRLAKLLRFASSNDKEKLTSLTDYVERMKEKQDKIYYMAGTSRKEVESSPFVERLIAKGYEVLFLTEAVDEYCLQSMPEFDGKKFQNVAKEGLTIDASEKAKEAYSALEKEYQPLVSWLTATGLKDLIEKAVVSQRLVKSPSALVAASYGWSGNMERIMK
ncbi:unnamed protein product, partial [Nippostrongylus brasiliensis]|uniref:HATPase_c domain-containing protein n=1 Tax=Nippostrongylus brasiliensis TaxID=27835 RepID=A0A0N4YMN5_NIPBR